MTPRENKKKKSHGERKRVRDGNIVSSVRVKGGRREGIMNEIRSKREPKGGRKRERMKERWRAK